MITKSLFLEQILKLNYDVFTKINTKIPDLTNYSEIEIDDTLENAVGYLDEDQYGNYKIFLAPKMGQFDESYKAYQRFKKRNNSTSIKDFVEYAITHEYGHIIDYTSAYTCENYLKAITHKITPEQNSAISEGFAFWFANSVTKMNGFDNEVKEKYSKRIDSNILAKMFEIYSIEEEINGFEYVAKNSREIFWKNKN